MKQKNNLMDKFTLPQSKLLYIVASLCKDGTISREENLRLKGKMKIT